MIFIFLWIEWFLSTVGKTRKTCDCCTLTAPTVYRRQRLICLRRCISFTELSGEKWKSLLNGIPATKPPIAIHISSLHLKGVLWCNNCSITHWNVQVSCSGDSDCGKLLHDFCIEQNHFTLFHSIALIVQQTQT